MSRDLLRRPRFAPFFWTQALGAFNDNLFKNALLLLLTFVVIEQRGWDTGVVNNLAAGLFILPFLLFSAWGGLLADRLDKQRLIVRLKWLELATMSVAAGALIFEAWELLLALLFMMGTQSALFGPVKYAILPQHLKADELVSGNAWVELGTFLAILVGTLAAAALMALGGELARWALSASLVSLAVLGVLAAMRIPPAPSASPGPVPWRPLSGSVAVMREGLSNRRLRWALLGISAFWFLGASYLTQLPAYARDIVHGAEGATSALLAAFAIGIGLGSLACERVSRGRLETGLVPFGALIIFAGGLDLALRPALAEAQMATPLIELLGIAGFWRMWLDLGVIGFGGGLYIVPLYTLLQLRSPEDHRARMIAANNVLNALLMVLSAGAGILVLGVMGRDIPDFLLLLSLISGLIAVICMLRDPRPFLRLIIFILIHLMYRLHLKGRWRIPAEGAALVVCNHVSFMDALILGGASPRPLRFLMDAEIYHSPWLKWFFRIAGAIPVDSSRKDPAGVRRSLEEVGMALREGEVVMIFPEGKLTRDGEVGRFRRGLELILARDPAPVIPMALGGLWGSWFSHGGGPAFAKWPRRLRGRVELCVGRTFAPENVKAAELEEAVRDLHRKATRLADCQ
ncbi:MFS transporter [Cobetia sp. 10Alg 146]|uniref:MFS transporter n=1 Tax=Cobetia sp. 10Alg 146 TaxID=3040019 RepID=UPI00244AE598|nr:MFS transporter [Cobetia sp. 10Alg 146]MDH2292939.1 MFS transporter [Cobetia sp. 10Alg 146]